MNAAVERPRGGRVYVRIGLSLLVWVGVAAVFFVLKGVFPSRFTLCDQGRPLFEVLGLVAAVLAGADLLSLLTTWALARRKKPPAEGLMIRRVYRLVALLAIIVIAAYGFGKLGTFGTFFSLFGGMLLGWSLQAPVSGFAAWVLVSIKRPFRPGDRIQFPSLGLVGDVKDIGPMYTILDQVGGTIGSEEAVGRFILVPNAMLFGQVVINYTVTQEAAYMLDEAVVRITYDSDWNRAERILLDAAQDVTRDIVEATGVQPYIRSDLYDYGVYLRLRYQTRVKDRAEIAYLINKKIFEDIQRDPKVDLAIPYVYSYRAATDRKEDSSPRSSGGVCPFTTGPGFSSVPEDKESVAIRQIDIDQIQPPSAPDDPQDVQRLAERITSQGLLQPIVVAKNPKSDRYDILAGQLRFHACKHLGWKTIPAVIRDIQA